MTYQSEVLADSPWGYWRLQETSGTVLGDASPNNRDMTTFASPTLGVAGPVGSNGKAVAFSSTTGQRGQTGATVVTTTATLEVWVYLSALPAANTPLLGAATSYATTGAEDKSLIVTPTGKLNFYVYGGAASANVLSSTALTLNTWHHVVASVGAAGSKIRVNKTTVGENLGATTSWGGSAYQVLLRAAGSRYPEPWSPVTIAEPAFYTTQLSDARTDAHYDAALVPAGVTVSGDSFAAGVTAVDGEAVAASTGIVAGESFAITAAALDGTIAPFAKLVAGEPFVVATSAIDGVVVGAQIAISGESFAVATATLDGAAVMGAATGAPLESSTDAVDRSNGRTRVCEWTVDVEPPVAEPTRTRGHDYAITGSMAGVTFDDGRPT